MKTLRLLTFLGLTVSVLIACRKPEFSDESLKTFFSLNREVIFRDDFDNNDNNWKLGINDEDAIDPNKPFVANICDGALQLSAFNFGTANAELELSEIKLKKYRYIGIEIKYFSQYYADLYEVYTDYAFFFGKVKIIPYGSNPTGFKDETLHLLYDIENNKVLSAVGDMLFEDYPLAFIIETEEESYSLKFEAVSTIDDLGSTVDGQIIIDHVEVYTLVK